MNPSELGTPLKRFGETVVYISIDMIAPTSDGASCFYVNGELAGPDSALFIRDSILFFARRTGEMMCWPMANVSSFNVGPNLAFRDVPDLSMLLERQYAYMEGKDEGTPIIREVKDGSEAPEEVHADIELDSEDPDKTKKLDKKLN